MRRYALPLLHKPPVARRLCSRLSHSSGDTLWSPGTFQQRVLDLKVHHGEKESFPGALYPRMSTQSGTLSIASFKEKYSQGSVDELAGGAKSTVATLNGNIQSVRRHGSKLIFVDLAHREEKVQIMCNLGSLQSQNLDISTAWQAFRSVVQVGDHYSFTGHPTKTSTGQLALQITTLPKLLSPSLHRLPETVTDEQTLARFPQLALVLRRKKRDLLRLRHTIEMTIQNFLNSKSFTKVSTPVLAADTGGAVARAFETSANEFSGHTLKLRIAQELELKKLVAAGMGAVYEIGPVFRNEGIDSTHNPEFTTCEFYQPYATLDDLMDLTEDLFHALHMACKDVMTPPPLLQNINWNSPGRKFQQLPFIPTLLRQLRSHGLPDFQLPVALSEHSLGDLKTLFAMLKMPLPAQPSTTRLLDVLASRFIEPLCTTPTFVTGYPAVMSPLAKSYLDPETGHLLSARAELFVNGTEYINMYEEENDPFAQTKKFLLQQSDGAVDFDAPHEALVQLLTPGQRYYVKVLEMGLPPTAGWGCGIERFTMLFGGAQRIGDVLPFGTLRNVVAMGTGKGSENQ